MYNVSEGHTLLLCFSKRWPSGNHKKWLKNQLKPAFQTGERWWQPIKPDEHGDQAFRFSITFTFSFSHLQSGERWWRRMETRWAWQPWVRQGEHKDHVMIYWQFFGIDLQLFWIYWQFFGLYRQFLGYIGDFLGLIGEICIFNFGTCHIDIDIKWLIENPYLQVARLDTSRSDGEGNNLISWELLGHRHLEHLSCFDPI